MLSGIGSDMVRILIGLQSYERLVTIPDSIHGPKEIVVESWKRFNSWAGSAG